MQQGSLDLINSREQTPVEKVEVPYVLVYFAIKAVSHLYSVMFLCKCLHVLWS